MEVKKRKLLVKTVESRKVESYLSVQHGDLMFGYHQEIVIISVGRLLDWRKFCFQVLSRQLYDVIVINVHSLGRLFLVLAGAVVIALIVVQFVGFRARTLIGRKAHVMRTLSRSHDASASNETEKKIETRTQSQTRIKKTFQKQENFGQYLQ